MKLVLKRAIHHSLTMQRYTLVLISALVSAEKEIVIIVEEY